ncbi:MAG: MBL fold metallo-hydrolase [Alphaproteobacteria bacterium]
MAQEKTTWTSVGGNNDERIGGNAHVYTYTDESGKTKRILVDLGGMFSDKEDSGYDRFLANPSKYLDRVDEKGNLIKAEEPVDAVFLTHCHDDHIGAIPHLCAMGFKFPEIKASPFAAEMVDAIFFKQRVQKNLKPTIKRIQPGDVTKVGDISVEAVAVSHSAPGSFGFYIKTPDAKIFHSGDFKTDQSVPLGPKTDLKRIEEISKEGVDAFMFDATSVTTPGMTPPESDIKDEFKKITKECEGLRMVVPLIARSVERFASLYEAAADSGRAIVLQGGSLTTAYTALQNAGYDLGKITGKHAEVYDGRAPEVKKLDPRKTMVICTGTQAEENAVLNMASLGIHRGLKFQGGQDIVVMAQSVIPVSKNQENVDAMFGRIRDMGITVIEPSHRKTDGSGRKTHASGHGAEEDIKLMFKTLTAHAPEGHKMTGIPVHGGMHHLRRGAEVAHECGSNSLIHPNAVTMEISGKEGIKVVNNEVSKETWIGVLDKSEDFRNPKFDYHVVDGKFKKISEIEYNKEKAFFCADAMSRGGSQKGKGKGGFDPRRGGRGGR